MTPLHYASWNGHLNIVKFLISKNVDIDPIETRFGDTPLMLASFKGYYNISEYLLDHGSNVNQQTKDKYTALNYAIGGNHINVAKLLIKRGANINLKNTIGTPLEYAKFLTFKWKENRLRFMNYFILLKKYQNH